MSVSLEVEKVVLNGDSRPFLANKEVRLTFNSVQVIFVLHKQSYYDARDNLAEEALPNPGKT